LGLTAASLVTAVALSASVASATPYISVNFDSDTSNALPSGTDYANAPSGTQAIVVDASTTTPTDPFGGSTNKSLMMEDQSNSDNPIIIYKGAPAGLSSGTFSIQIYAATGTGYTQPLGVIHLGQNSAVNSPDIGAWLNFSDSGLVVNNSIALDNALTANTAYDVTLTFDAVAHTYSGTIAPSDGSSPVAALTANSGSTTSFPFYSSGFNAITTATLITGYPGRTNTRVFFDNLQMNAVPEPASMGLLGLGCLLAMRRGRR
jgi:hypothetical protein